MKYILLTSFILILSFNSLLSETRDVLNSEHATTLNTDCSEADKESIREACRVSLELPSPQHPSPLIEDEAAQPGLQLASAGIRDPYELGVYAEYSCESEQNCRNIIDSSAYCQEFGSEIISQYGVSASCEECVSKKCRPISSAEVLRDAAEAVTPSGDVTCVNVARGACLR